MPVIISANDMKKAFNGLFMKAYAAAEVADLIPLLASVVPSNTLIEQYDFFGDVPKMQEWVDEKSVRDLKKFTQSITNLDWEVTLGVKKTDMEDNTLGGVKMRVNELGMEARLHPSRNLTELRESNPTAYDGQDLYSDTHDETGSNQDNLLGGNGIDSLSHFRTDFTAARKALLSFTTDTGKKFNNPLMRLAVVVPPDAEDVARQFLMAGLHAGGDSNVWKGAAELIVDHNLTDANDWYLDVVGAPLRAFIHQLRKKPVLTNSDKDLFMKKFIYFSAEARWKNAPGFWARTVKIVNS